MDQFGLFVEFPVGLMNLLIVVTMFTVLAFMTNLNGFPMLTFTSGTKDIFRLILYDAHLFYGLLFTSLFRKHTARFIHHKIQNQIKRQYFFNMQVKT